MKTSTRNFVSEWVDETITRAVSLESLVKFYRPQLEVDSCDTEDLLAKVGVLVKGPEIPKRDGFHSFSPGLGSRQIFFRLRLLVFFFSVGSGS